MNAHSLRCIYAAVVFSFSTSQALALTYTITTIADTTSAFTDFPDAAATINNSGTVAYKAEVSSSNLNIYSSASGTPIITNQLYASEPVISDSGTVAIAMDDGAGVMGVYNGTLGSFIIDNTGSIYEDFSDVAINSSDTVAFVGEFNSGVDFAIAKTPPLSALADTTGTFSDFGDSGINDSGTVMYIARFDTGSTASLYSSASATPIFSTTNILTAAINNNETIAYTDTTAVYTNTAGTVLSSGGTFNSFARVAINNTDTLAVLGEDTSGNSAIHAYNGFTLDKVIDTNDLLAPNSITVGFNMGRYAINDSGQIVFWATYVDLGTFTSVEGIYLATPNVLLGDTNANGIVNSADYLLLTQFLLGLKTPTASQITAGDMNLDAVLTPSDLLLHLRTIMGYI